MEMVESDGCHRFTCISIFHHGVLLFESLEFGPTSDGIEGGDQTSYDNGPRGTGPQNLILLLYSSVSINPPPHMSFLLL